MKTRIIVGLLLLSLLSAMLIIGRVVFAIGIAFLAVCAVFEMGKAMRAKGYTPSLMPAYVYAALFSFVDYYLGRDFLFPFGLLTMMASMICFLFSKDRDFDKFLPSLTVFAYPLAFITILVLVYDLIVYADIGLSGALLAFAAPEIADAFAYFCGTFFGKKKLCPELSPKKTVAGSIGSIIGGTVFGLTMFPLQKLWGGSVSSAVMILIGFLSGISAQFGDLFASALKRWAGIKDFSSIFPGHGGVLDRIDSILFTAPLVYIIFMLRMLLIAHC